MPVRECKVSFVDARGVRHSVSVYASSVLEAAAAGLKQIRETQMVEDDGVFDVTVDLFTTTARSASWPLDLAAASLTYCAFGTAGAGA